MLGGRLHGADQTQTPCLLQGQDQTPCLLQGQDQPYVCYRARLRPHVCYRPRPRPNACYRARTRQLDPMFARPALVCPRAGPTSNHTPEYSTTSVMAAKNIGLTLALEHLARWASSKEKYKKTHSPDALADSVEEVDIQFLCLQVQEYN